MALKGDKYFCNPRHSPQCMQSPRQSTVLRIAYVLPIHRPSYTKLRRGDIEVLHFFLLDHTTSYLINRSSHAGRLAPMLYLTFQHLLHFSTSNKYIKNQERNYHYHTCFGGSFVQSLKTCATA